MISTGRTLYLVVLILEFPFFPCPFRWKHRLWWIKSRRQGALVALSAANCLSAPLNGSRVSSGIRTGGVGVPSGSRVGNSVDL